VSKFRQLKDVSEHRSRVAIVTFKDTTGPNVLVSRVAIYRILFYVLMLLWSYHAESRASIFAGLAVNWCWPLTGGRRYKVSVGDVE
jgi:hypothetical protein